jgi:hypothetical protein
MSEHEELAQWLDDLANDYDDLYPPESSLKLYRAAALLRQPGPAPVPVPVAERPWERPGWCDAKGRCWWFAPTEAIPGGFRCAGWSLYAGDPADEDTHCLPHWAIPQPPQANTTHPTPTENDGTN